MSKIYPFGYNPAAVGMMQTRTATACASLFLKHASPGMRVLDVGCGPGSITVGLAHSQRLLFRSGPTKKFLNG